MTLRPRTSVLLVARPSAAACVLDSLSIRWRRRSRPRRYVHPPSALPYSRPSARRRVVPPSWQRVIRPFAAQQLLKVAVVELCGGRNQRTERGAAAVVGGWTRESHCHERPTRRDLAPRLASLLNNATGRLSRRMGSGAAMDGKRQRRGADGRSRARWRAARRGGLTSVDGVSQN